MCEIFLCGSVQCCKCFGHLSPTSLKPLHSLCCLATSRTPPNSPTTLRSSPGISCSPPPHLSSWCAPPAGSEAPQTGCRGQLACLLPLPAVEKAVEADQAVEELPHLLAAAVTVPKQRTVAATAAMPRTGTNTDCTAGNTLQ